MHAPAAGKLSARRTAARAELPHRDLLGLRLGQGHCWLSMEVLPMTARFIIIYYLLMFMAGDLAPFELPDILPLHGAVACTVAAMCSPHRGSL